MRGMKCPRCGEEMKDGCIYLADFGTLHWVASDPKSLRRSHIRYPEGSVRILNDDPIWSRGKENWLRRAYRCEKCGLITFEEKYTLSSEEKKS